MLVDIIFAISFQLTGDENDECYFLCPPSILLTPKDALLTLPTDQHPALHLPTPHNTQATTGPDECSELCPTSANIELQWAKQVPWTQPTPLKDKAATGRDKQLNPALPVQWQSCNWPGECSKLHLSSSRLSPIMPFRHKQPTQGMPTECVTLVARGDCASAPHKTVPTRLLFQDWGR